MSEGAAELVDHVLPDFPIRQWVLTVPFPLRFPQPHLIFCCLRRKLAGTARVGKRNIFARSEEDTSKESMLMKTYLAVFFVAWGCGGDNGSSTGRDASTAGESGGGRDGGAESLQSTGGSDGGSGGSAGQTTEVVRPEEMDARQSVTFELTNEAGASLFVPTKGLDCDLFAVEHWRNDAWQSLPLGFKSVSEQCGCPGMNCDYLRPQVSHFVLSQVGDVTTFIWDARALVTWDYVECDSASGEPIMRTFGVPQPVEAGRYRVTMGYELVAPESCVEDDTGALDCNDYLYANWPGFRPLCPTAQVVTTEFELPASGNAVVPVTLDAP